MPNNLEKFNTDTKNCILEWASKFRGSLLLIKWDKDKLRQRNIRKSTVVNIICNSQNCSPFPANAQSKSYSIFCFDNHQIIINITSALERAYYQEDIASFGKVYVVSVEGGNNFKVEEILNVF
ncbi:hypothetical protein GLOIN_2v1844563 [Rhizophagus clarus]|uniref:Uncharacterized protein n=1 Tax=Rhizophagus clarus TaxID=94130 RepID=A0A8H3L4X7_9GLOM|nr:hypothetical protein GLOIN_2v1844563 [Rhizophagus clarus]